MNIILLVAKVYIWINIHTSFIHIFGRTTVRIKEDKEDKLFICMCE